MVKCKCSNKMKIKIRRTPKNSKINILNKFGYLTKKLGTHKKQNIAHFSTNHNNHYTTLNQIQAHSNPELQIEIERQKCNGLLYANITKFK